MRGALLEVSGYVRWKHTDPGGGRIFQQGEGHNLIVDDGLEWIAGRLQENWDHPVEGPWLPISVMKAGDGADPVLFSDSALAGTIYDEMATSHSTDVNGDLGGQGVNYGLANTVLWNAQFTHPGDAATTDIEEFGLFNADDIMLARFLSGTISGMTNGDLITVAWAITVGTMGE